MNEKKFDGKGQVYSKSRPTYPAAFIDFLYGQVGITKESTVADIGSGTGIHTRLLLEKGSRVMGVEPNEDMRKVAEKELVGFKNFVSIGAAAENTGLKASTVNFVTAAQSFHWFNRQLFKDECRRILTPTGKVILVWNHRDASAELVKENHEINSKFCKDYKGFSGSMDRSDGKDDYGDFFDGEYTVKTFENNISFDLEGFTGRNLSSSYAPTQGDINYDPYVEAVKELFYKYSKNGVLYLPHFTRCYVGSC